MKTKRAPRESRAMYEAAGVDVAEYDELIARIYQGPLDAAPWSDALEQLRKVLGATWVTLIMRAPTIDRHVPLMIHASEASELVPGDWQVSYDSHYYALDPFVGLPADRVVTVDEVFGETGWLSSELYKQFLKPQDIRYVLGADLRTASGVECRFRVCKTSTHTQFSARDKAICELLLPHLKRSVELHSRLDTAEVSRSIYENAIDQMQIGMVTLDENGAIIDTNRAADEILAQHNGIRLLHGAIEADDVQENRQLQQLIRSAMKGHHGTSSVVVEAMPITRDYDKPRLGVLVRTIPLSDWSGDNSRRPAVALLLRDPDRKPEGAHEIVRKLFDLTPAEASLALLLTNGLTLDEAADESGISKNTARTHLRAIFSKTGVTRQATLVRIMLGSVVPFE
ncbi:helix-turn-helix transcriptional regulator [Burkholderia anthina]|uniref:helix-turn-helix transcriptional regulator n=1 Tax=Burkholderia anthina TaxID=179879 RepID=UPI0015895072|nr:helix-turn-helix transcriptional regulator [Burkholderia anthina]